MTFRHYGDNLFNSQCMFIKKDALLNWAILNCNKHLIWLFDSTWILLKMACRNKVKKRIFCQKLCFFFVSIPVNVL